MRRTALLFALALATPLVACGDDGPNDTDTDTGVDASADASPDADTSADVGDVDTSDAASDAADGVDTDADTADVIPDAAVELHAALATPAYADIDATVTLDAGASTGAVRFAWDLGDGRTEETTEPTLDAAWDAMGRYRVTVTAYDAGGDDDRASATVTVTAPPAYAPRRSGTIAIWAEADRMAVVSPDSDEVAVFSGLDDDELSLETRLSTCANPRNVTYWGDRLAVSCPDSDEVALFDGRSGLTQEPIALPWGARPFGVVSDGERLFVALQGRGELAMIEDAPGGWSIQRLALGPDLRGVTLTPNGEALVSRWRSERSHGAFHVVDIDAFERVDTLTLPYDDVPPSDTESGGVPTYLDTIAVSPNGADAAVPSLQANVGQGLRENGEELTHETTVRAALHYVDLDTMEEDAEHRKRFDDRGFGNAAVYSPRGDYIYVSMRGSRAVERIDAFNRTQSGTQFALGFAPQDVAVYGDRLFVDVYLSRELLVFEAATFGTVIEPVQRLPLVEEEPLSAELLLGKQLFNDSFDIRVAKDSYIACSHCHLDGESDHRVWDFTDRGEGIRNTITLLGRAGMEHGPVHWSANFDEIQDFEHDMRGPFLGLGLMSDADFYADGRDTSLGAPKAGVSADLDALAAYVESLDAYPRSPHRADDGALTDSAERGQALFESTELGCTNCHSGTHFTDSQFLEPGVPLLHDVGTLTEASGQRLHGDLPGLDTPTLRGIWNEWPYLHDGSANTVADAIIAGGDAHGVTSDLTDQELADLEAFVLSLE